MLIIRSKTLILNTSYALVKIEEFKIR